MGITYAHLWRVDDNVPSKTKEKCPLYYSEVGGLKYFLMNKEVPDKFLFINLGQDSIASDGTIGEVNDWSRSIKILR